MGLQLVKSKILTTFFRMFSKTIGIRLINFLFQNTRTEEAADLG
jgi:hypothetical protein